MNFHFRELTFELKLELELKLKLFAALCVVRLRLHVLYIVLHCCCNGITYI